MDPTALAVPELRARAARPPDRLRGRAPARRRQAGRARRPPGRRARVGTLVQGCSTGRHAAAIPSGPGSSTASTGTRPACSSSPAPRRHTRGCGRWSRRASSSASTWRSCAGRPRSRSGPDRGADRPRPPRADAPLARHGHAEGRGHALRGGRAASATTRCCACGSRPGARTRSACTSPRSGCPVAGDPVYGAPEPGLRRQFLHAARLAFPHPVTGSGWRRSRRCRPTCAAALERVR